MDETETEAQPELKPAVAAPPVPEQAKDRNGQQPTGDGGPNDKDTITKEWHERRLRKESQKRDRAEAKARQLETELKAYREREAKASVKDMLKDLGIPPEQAALAGALEKFADRFSQKFEERLAQQGERFGALSEEFTKERRKAAFRGLSDEQQELVDAITEESGLKNPSELLALAKLRDPELFAGYEPEKGSWETSPARGSPSRRRGEPTIDEQIATLEKEIADPANKRRLHTELGPKLMGLQRLRQQGMR